LYPVCTLYPPLLSRRGGRKIKRANALLNSQLVGMDSERLKGEQKRDEDSI